MEWLLREEILIMVVKVVLGFVAALGGILLWSQTRKASWIFLVLGSFFQYLEVLSSLLDYLGLFSSMDIRIGEVSLIKVALAALVPIFYSMGFLFAFRDFKKHEDE